MALHTDDDEMTLHFEDRDENGNEYNGGEAMVIAECLDAVELCADRGSRGTVWQGGRKIAEITADGDWRWVP